MKRGSQKVLHCEVNLVKYPFWGQGSDQIATKAGFEKNNYLHPNPNSINLPPSHPFWRLFSLSLIHIFAARSAIRAEFFYWDGLDTISKSKNRIKGIHYALSD